MLARIDLIHERMDVVSCDGKLIGHIDCVLASDLKVADAEQDPRHLLPLGYVAVVDDKVRLVVTDAEARRTWRQAW